jgi:hypothetical protein
MKRRAKADADLRRIIRNNLPHVHWTSIESALTGSGIPDLHGCWKGVDAWIETKWTDGWSPKIRPFQISWLARRARSGGRGFIAVRRLCVEGTRRAASDELWLYKGEDAAKLKALGLQGLAPLARFKGGPAKWPWAWIESLIFQRK